MGTEPPPELGLFVLNFFMVMTFDWGLLGLILVLLTLLVFSALISGSEVAFFSLNKNDVEDLRKENENDRIIKLKDKPRSLLATILISNNFINIAIIIISDLIFTALIPEGYFDGSSTWLRENIFFLNGFTTEVLSAAIIFIIIVVGVTFLLVLFGEVLPKIYASRNNLKFATFHTYSYQF